MVWAVRARTDSIRTPGRPLRDSGVELIMLAFIECKNELHEPTADTAEETEADLPAMPAGFVWLCRIQSDSCWSKG
jgi:hypothetical protein